MHDKQRTVIVIAFATLFLFGCSYPSAAPATIAPALSPTMYFQTLSALQTHAVMTATAQGVVNAFTPMGGTPIPATGGQQQGKDAIAIRDALCWAGPGPRFEVISAIFKGTQVELLGRTLVPNWLIVRNPIYLDPCWVQAADLQVFAGFDLNGLPIFNLPSTPTVTIAPTPTGGTLTAPAPTGTSAPVSSPTTAPVGSPTTAPTTAPSATPPPPSSTP